jgi:hypothetical protein
MVVDYPSLGLPRLLRRNGAEGNALGRLLLDEIERSKTEPADYKPRISVSWNGEALGYFEHAADVTRLG